MPTRAKIFIALTAAIGVAVVAASLWHWHSDDVLRFFCYLAIAVFASSLKVRLPGIDGTMSVNFLFILLGVLELSLPETLLIGCSAALVQCLWRTNQSTSPEKIAFNVFSNMANAIALAYFAYHRFILITGNRATLVML